LDYTRTVNSRSVLVHNVPEFNEPISFLTLESDGEAGVKISRPPVTTGEPLLSSSATLTNTVALHVFEDPASGFCRGIIVEYKNGAQRALGECRLGEHRVRVYKTPTHICMTRRITRTISCKDVRVKAVTDPDHRHERVEAMRCYPMSGKLEFLFDREHTHIDHVSHDFPPGF
jgi:hypothetical protein